jgi:hypothetical protein
MGAMDVRVRRYVWGDARLPQQVKGEFCRFEELAPK